ncbi:putative ATP-dependent helicase, partial [Lachnellula occidentalis]
MSSPLEDFDFQKYINFNQSPDEFPHTPDRSQQAADHAMSGMNPTSLPPSPHFALPPTSPSQVPAEASLQKNKPIMHTPEPKREDSEEDLLSGIPYVPAADDAGLEEEAGEEHFTPEPGMGGNALHLPELASPIHFGSMFAVAGASLEQGLGVGSGRDDGVYSSVDPIEHTPEPAPSVTMEDHNDRESPSPSEDDHLGTQVEHLTIEDDDFVMIDAKDASKEARSKWAEKKIPIVVEKPVKEEPRDDALFRLPTPPPINALTMQQMQQMMAAQKAMIQGSHRKNDTTKASMFGPRKSVEGESSHRKRPSFVQIGDEHEHAKAAMADPDENDLSWMDEEDTGRDEEYENLVMLRDALQMRQDNGKLTQGENLELYNLKKRIESKDRVKRAVARALDEVEEDEDEESLFVPVAREEVVGNHIRDRPTQSTLQNGRDATLRQMLHESLNGGIGDLDDSGNPKPAKGKPRKKATGKRPANAREVRAQEDAKREQARAKTQKGKRAPVAKSGGKKAAAVPKPKGKAKAAKNGNATSRLNVTTRSGSLLRPANGFNRNSGQDPAGRIILEDLILNDPINDRINDPAFNVDPEVAMEGQQRKASQFQKLFANIPSGGNKNTVRDDKKKLQDASKSFGYAKVRAVNGKWLIKGMTSPLYHHQLLGAQWMVSRELSAEPPHGGLLADSMGLGKTVQTLACMVGNPPTASDLKRNIKATLIVVPAAVLDQWMDEIEFHTEPGLYKKVLRYKTSSQISAAIMQDMDIVVTTYNEVMRQFPYPDKKERLIIETIGYRKWWMQAMQQVGDLHTVNWYRIVLDEAHAIKNNATRTSLACQNLKSIYRWCLTGTPLLNRLEELFPYLRFLKAHYSIDLQTFQKYFCDPRSDDSQNRIATLLSYTMMRRTMKTTIMNRPIITLPKPHPVVLYINFSPEEQIIYRITENRFRSNINRYFEAGEVRRNYSVFMVQLLRLRQCTSHPFMLERTIKEAWTLEDVNELHDKFEKLGAHGAKPFYEQTKGEELGPLLPFGRGEYGRKFDMQKAFSGLSEAELHQRVNCGFCSDVPHEPMETDCGHLFCRECLETYMHGIAAGGDDEFTTCPSCNQLFTEAKPREIASDDDDDDANPGGSGGRKGKKNLLPRDSKGRDAMGFEPVVESLWLYKSDVEPDFSLAPSAKTTALKATLLKGFEEAPLDKVVIYVQFRLLARIIGRMCASEGWGFLYLSGDCSLEHRTKATKMFRDDPDIKILVSGLKCGGVGLNFPWANRCISLDLWWNHAVEQQAFGRIFRIGQSKETHMTRIVVKNSVDMRLLTMQMHKLQDLEKAIAEGDLSKGLSLVELAHLFGFLRKGADGEMVGVEADYDDG